jgi:hypothetical protein
MLKPDVISLSCCSKIDYIYGFLRIERLGFRMSRLDPFATTLSFCSGYVLLCLVNGRDLPDLPLRGVDFNTPLQEWRCVDDVVSVERRICERNYVSLT